jgi:hypothetical protein
LREINYPVFRLGEHKPIIKDGLVAYVSQFIEDDDSEKFIYRIVDDKNIPSTSLARRRLVLLKQGVLLKKISRAIFFLGDLIKVAKSSTWFIDNNGLVFNYEKSKKATLQFIKINKVIPISTGGAIIELKDIDTRFKCLYMPTANEVYAGVLKDGLGYILYGFSEIQHKNTWRMI